MTIATYADTIDALRTDMVALSEHCSQLETEIEGLYGKIGRLRAYCKSRYTCLQDANLDLVTDNERLTTIRDAAAALYVAGFWRRTEEDYATIIDDTGTRLREDMALWSELADALYPDEHVEDLQDGD